MDLTEQEQKFVALAIQGLCMRGGPKTFPLAIRITEKLGIKHHLVDYLKDWIIYAGGPKVQTEEEK